MLLAEVRSVSLLILYFANCWAWFGGSCTSFSTSSSAGRIAHSQGRDSSHPFSLGSSIVPPLSSPAWRRSFTVDPRHFPTCVCASPLHPFLSLNPLSHTARQRLRHPDKLPISKSSNYHLWKNDLGAVLTTPEGAFKIVTWKKNPTFCCSR